MTRNTNEYCIVITKSTRVKLTRNIARHFGISDTTFTPVRLVNVTGTTKTCYIYLLFGNAGYIQVKYILDAWSQQMFTLLGTCIHTRSCQMTGECFPCIWRMAISVILYYWFCSISDPRPYIFIHKTTRCKTVYRIFVSISNILYNTKIVTL